MPFRRRAPEEPPTTPARTAAIRLLGRRDYTAFELRRRLVEKGHAPDEIDRVLEALESEGAVNDQRAADAHVRTASRVKGRGRHRISRELEARGIAADVAARALGQIGDDDQDLQIAKLLSRKLGARKPDAHERQRLFQQLRRRGFDSGAIARALAVQSSIP